MEKNQLHYTDTYLFTHLILIYVDIKNHKSIFILNLIYQLVSWTRHYLACGFHAAETTAHKLSERKCTLNIIRKLPTSMQYLSVITLLLSFDK